jgi:hypothetical protein
MEKTVERRFDYAGLWVSSVRETALRAPMGFRTGRGARAVSRWTVRWRQRQPSASQGGRPGFCVMPGAGDALVARRQPVGERPSSHRRRARELLEIMPQYPQSSLS